MKLTPVVIDRITRLERLGWEYVEFVTHQYHRAVGNSCYVLTDSFIEAASDEEFEAAIKETHDPFVPAASACIH